LKESDAMPRYLVERRFAEGVQIPVDEPGVRASHVVTDNNLREGVTWLHSFVSPDKRRSFCIYDGPTPEAIRRAANRNKLPVHEITEVLVLDPYSYQHK
jgi:hypothetical protein